jgi:cytochrome c-type biogenesis protein CcmE
MKTMHIILLVLIAASIAVLVSFTNTTSTYDTTETAKEKSGTYVHLMAKLDKSAPIEYDALNNPNYLSFTAVDSLGSSVKVVYHSAKPDNLEMSDKLVLKGKFNDGYFECEEIQTKCPSKYKEAEAQGKTHPGNVPDPRNGNATN